MKDKEPVEKDKLEMSEHGQDSSGHEMSFIHLATPQSSTYGSTYDSTSSRWVNNEHGQNSSRHKMSFIHIATPRSNTYDIPN